MKNPRAPRPPNRTAEHPPHIVAYINEPKKDCLLVQLILRQAAGWEQFSASNLPTFISAMRAAQPAEVALLTLLAFSCEPRNLGRLRYFFRGEIMFSQKVFCQVSFWLVALTLTVTAQTRTENSRAASAASYLERGNQWLAKGDFLTRRRIWPSMAGPALRRARRARRRCPFLPRCLPGWRQVRVLPTRTSSTI